MEISEVTDTGALEAMHDEWNALVDTCANPVVYSRHEWIGAWWRHYGLPAGMPLHVICARSEGKLKGILPFTASTTRIKGLWGVRCAHLLAQSVSSYQDIVVAKGWERKVVQSALAYVVDAHPDWEIINLPRLHPQSVLLSRSVMDGCKGWSSVETQGKQVSPFILLPSTWEEFEAGLGKETRNCIRRAHKELSSTGPLAFHVADDPNSSEGGLDAFFEHHERKWGTNALLSRGYKQYKPFIMELLTRGQQSSLSQYMWISSGGRYIAGIICLDHNLKRYGVMVAYDSDLHSYQPGHAMVALAVRDAITTGFRVFDYGEGKEAYKYRYASHDTVTRHLMLARKRMKAKILLAAEGIARGRERQ